MLIIKVSTKCLPSHLRKQSLYALILKIVSCISKPLNTYSVYKLGNNWHWFLSSIWMDLTDPWSWTFVNDFLISHHSHLLKNCWGEAGSGCGGRGLFVFNQQWSFSLSPLILEWISLGLDNLSKTSFIK